MEKKEPEELQNRQNSTRQTVLLREKAKPLENSNHKIRNRRGTVF